VRPIQSQCQSGGLFDFGRSTVLVFGGVYGNIQALDALFDAAESLRIPENQMICTGDLVAYCADPEAVVSRVRQSDILTIQGNVEQSLATASEDCGCGFEENSTCDLLSASWYAYAREVLSSDAVRWMSTLPSSFEVTIGGFSLSAVHGAPSSINKFVFPGSPEAELRGELDLAADHGVIGGHSGLPFSSIVGCRLWHNFGALGIPANDGTPRVWFSTLTPRAGALEVRLHSLHYDHAAAAASIRTCGLPAVYATALETGYWPSDEIMPEIDRSRRGVPLLPNLISVPLGQLQSCKDRRKSA
jgi:hypothetical protein